MSAIVVDPPALEATARHLRAACTAARAVARASSGLPTSVTGSADLSAALRGHAEAWSATIERVDDRVRDVADLLAAGGRTYDQVEQCLSSTLGPASGR